MFNYDEIGEKIKGLAVWVAIVEAILSIIAGISIMTNEIDILGADSWVFMGPIIIILGPLSAWITSWLMYGFGEIVSAATKYQYSSKSTVDYSVNLTKAANKISPPISTNSRCAFCGKELPVGAAYCENCGESVSKPTITSTNKQNTAGHAPASSAKYQRCPECGEIVRSSVCDMCGKTNNLFD